MQMVQVLVLQMPFERSSTCPVQTFGTALTVLGKAWHLRWSCQSWSIFLTNERTERAEKSPLAPLNWAQSLYLIVFKTFMVSGSSLKLLRMTILNHMWHLIHFYKSLVLRHLFYVFLGVFLFAFLIFTMIASSDRAKPKVQIRARIKICPVLSCFCC